MKNKDVSSLFTVIVTAFQRYGLTIFIVILVSGLAAAVLILNTIVQQASDPTNYKSSTASTAFDQQTITRVKQLHSSTNFGAQIELPTGRISPFAE